MKTLYILFIPDRSKKTFENFLFFSRHHFDKLLFHEMMMKWGRIRVEDTLIYSKIWQDVDNMKQFHENIDFIDLLNVGDEITNNLLFDLGYSKMNISKAEHIYLLSERGYAKLIKIMDSGYK